MVKSIVMSLVIVTALWHAPALEAGTSYFVLSMKAKVMSGATFKSTVLGEADRGHQFISTGAEGRWIKVKYNDGEGYVHSLVLSTHPPIDTTSAIRGDEQELRRGFRRRASSSLGFDAERGLDRDDRKMQGPGDRADYESLEKIELFTMSSGEVKRFMEGQE